MAVSTIKGITRATYTVTYAGGWSFERIGDFVYLSMLNFSNVPAEAFSIGNIPETFRPPRDVNFTVLPRVSTARAPIAIIVEESGTVRGYNYGSALSGTTAFGETASYPII